MKINLDEIKIEKLTSKYIDSVTLLEKESFSEPWSRESLTFELENINANFFFATFREAVLGYIGSHCYSGECYISNIAVFKSFQNQKIGSLLLKYFIDFMKNKCDFISLEVRKSNLPAIKLYEKFGFKKVAIRKDFYKKPSEDALIYTLFFNDQKKGKENENISS